MRLQVLHRHQVEVKRLQEAAQEPSATAQDRLAPVMYLQVGAPASQAASIPTPGSAACRRAFDCFPAQCRLDCGTRSIAHRLQCVIVLQLRNS